VFEGFGGFWGGFRGQPWGRISKPFLMPLLAPGPRGGREAWPQHYLLRHVHCILHNVQAMRTCTLPDSLSMLTKETIETTIWTYGTWCVYERMVLGRGACPTRIVPGEVSDRVKGEIRLLHVLQAPPIPRPPLKRNLTNPTLHHIRCFLTLLLTCFSRVTNPVQLEWS
jgi:hypothetical protein